VSGSEAGSIYASVIQAKAVAALAEQGLSTANEPVHAWQTFHLAGPDRLMHASYPTFVGTGSQCVDDQQRTSELVEGSAARFRSKLTDRERIFLKVGELRTHCKQQGMEALITVIDNDTELSVIITTPFRCWIWDDHCAGGDDRNWDAQLIASVDGGGVR